MELKQLIAKAENLANQGFSQEQIESRLVPQLKNPEEKKILTNKIFDYCFQYSSVKEVHSQIKLKIAAGLFAFTVGLFIIALFLEVSLVLIAGGLYYAYINFKKLKLPLKELNYKSRINKKDERRF